MSAAKVPVINSQLDKMNTLLGMMVKENNENVFTWSQVSEIVRHGLATNVFTIGDQLVTTYKNTAGTEYQMPWDVVAFQNVTINDGDVVPAMILQSHYATNEGIQFDAPEPDNARGADGATDSNIASYGYNRWSESGVRAWLNSDAAAGSWFGTSFERNGSSVNRQEYDVAPSQHESINGFMKGLPTDFLEVVKPIAVSTKCNTVTDAGVIDVTHDKFWLPSNTELFTSAQAVEGQMFPYWKERLGLSAPLALYKDYAPNVTYALENHTSPQRVWRRSSNVNYSCNAWHSNTSGNVGYGGAILSFRCAPACAIC